MPTIEDIQSWRGHEARGTDGDKLGKIEEISLDRTTDEPEWIAVKTGLFGGHLSFVPLAEARLDGDAVTVPYDKATVKDAPRIEPDGELEPITDANVDCALDGPEISEEEHEVVLHSEEAVAEKRAVPKERVRLDKDVVTEEQTVSDEVRQERIDVEGDRA